MRQTKEAMETVLRALRPGDTFNIVRFESEVVAWMDSGLVKANQANIERAVAYVNDLEATGGESITKHFF